MTVILRDVNWLDPETGSLAAGDLVVAGGAAAARDFHRAGEFAPAAGDTVIDGRGGLAMPGLVCAHHHLYSGLARGMPAPPRQPRDFAEILELVWWRLDRRLDHAMIRASAQAAALDCLRCGVTAVVDHHASPFAAAGSLAVIADALDEIGLAHVLCYELSDRDGPEVAAAGLAETERHLASGRPALVGLHASFTVGDELLRRAVALAHEHGTGLHLHVAEGAVDQERCLADHGRRVVARLHAAGALDLEGTILAHCLHLDDRERELVRDSAAWIAHNPESNQNNEVGAFDPAGLPAGRILIGTDGMHGDMLRSARAAALVSGGLDAERAWAALAAGRRYLRRHHAAAARAGDVVLLDYRPPTPLTAANVVGHFAFGLDARQVRTVICDGRVVLQDGRFTSLDEDAVLAGCRDEARRLWAALRSR